jgi:hypothetical protein
MAKKETTERKPFNFGNSTLVKTTEQTVVEGYQAIENKEQGGGESSGNQPTAQVNPQAATAAEKPAMSARQDEPTKGVQANLPISLYNRMKRLKFETDESFQSMFQRAMELFLDVEEGKLVVNNPIKQ